MNPGEAQHEEDGHLVPVEGFDYDQVDEFLFGRQAQGDLARCTQRELDASREAMRRLLQWVWQNGMQNTKGLMIRSIVVCWVFLEELRPMNLTEVARGFGMKKQSIGRWVDEFKVCFPMFRTPHMRHRGRKASA